jgi:hypothetical protein
MKFLGSRKATIHYRPRFLRPFRIWFGCLFICNFTLVSCKSVRSYRSREILTGEAPFSGWNITKLQKEVVKNKTRPDKNRLIETCGHLNKSLWALMTQMWDPLPKNR